MHLLGNFKTWDVDDVATMREALAQRDARGGAIFRLSRASEQFPALAIRITGNAADVHYFPEGGHPGFRCIGGDGLPADGFTTLIYQGCDPDAGEVTPNAFIIPDSAAVSVAMEFFLHAGMPETVRWFEL